MRPRQKLFADYISTRGGVTYGNGTQSAVKAGYSVKSATKIASDLLKKQDISTYITQKEKEQDRQWALTRDGAIAEARHNYEQCKEPRLKKQWYDTWIQMQGWLINKQEVNQNVEISQAKQSIITEMIKLKVEEIRAKHLLVAQDN